MNRMTMKNVVRSLEDVVGTEYVEAACAAGAALTGRSVDVLTKIARSGVEFCPEPYRRRLDELAGMVGSRVCPGLAGSAAGAGTQAFRDAGKTAPAPVAGLGPIRVGEDGRAYLAAKSEHYHTSVGHGFPGFELVENARRIGVRNATHNNTRGHINRLLETELIRSANGIDPQDDDGLTAVLETKDPHVLNRVMNLQTGSLAAEATLKIMLARFYRSLPEDGPPEHAGKTPVILVVGDNAGGVQANYHGTTVLTQLMRGMWGDLAERMAAAGILRIEPVPINDLDGFRSAVDRRHAGESRVAGFIHEIVMMNYGAIRLTPEYLQGVYEICHERDIPVAADEVQSGAWCPEVFLFSEYGLKPDLVSLGKGFSGGEFAASKVLISAPLDNLDQFGALVTNGQEELSSLAYLVVLTYIRENRQFVRDAGRHYQDRLRELASGHTHLVNRIEGYGHMSSVVFHRAEDARAFAERMNEYCVDISTQSYKAVSIPAALTKLPLIATQRMINELIEKMNSALSTINR